MPDAVAQDCSADFGGELRPHQRLGEIRCRGDAEHGMHPLGRGAGQEGCDPAAHGTADQQLRAGGQLVQHHAGVAGPAADRTGLETAAGLAMAGIVETAKGLTAGGGPGGEGFGLAACHVGFEAAEKDDARAAAGEAAKGDGGAVFGRDGSDVFHGACITPLAGGHDSG